MPLALKVAMTSLRNFWCALVSQPELEVSASRYLGRQDLERQVDETVDGVAFHIQFGGDYLLQVADILVADVPLVGTRMHGDALCPEPFRIERCLHHVGNIPSARIAQCGDLVDVNTQLCHIFLYFCGVKVHITNENHEPGAREFAGGRFHSYS